MKNNIVNYVNRIAFILDESSSMSHLKNDIIRVFDSQINHLAEMSKRLNQETRVSLYTFSDNVRNLIWEKDVLRLPSIKDHYNPSGCTALIDATLKVILDYEKTPQIYGDYAQVLFCLSDGECNRNEHLADDLKRKINSLPENWTVVFLAPNASGIVEAKRYGFPAQNIQVWSTNQKGLNEIGENIRKVTENFMVARSQGVRGTKSLFKLDASNLTTTAVKSKLQELSPKDYEVLPVRQEGPIREYVEKFTGKPFTIGSGYYQLTKKETIQASKNVCIRNKKNGKVFSGPNARQLLGLPNAEIKVAPEFSADFDIYVQSSSVNRKLIKGTDLIILK